MKILLVLVVFTVLLLWYALQGRQWLKSKPWAEGFFALVEPVEIVLFKKSETILFARMKVILGVVLTLLTEIGSINLMPLMPLIPEAYAPYVQAAFNLLPLAITVVGMMDERLRNTTTKPIELVAVADSKITPEIAIAIDKAEEKKAEAVAAVTDKAA
ncbi:MAG: hypothetical protein ABFD89_18505 [Bryobacteraceae bacterium]